jgi:hypothetical protein
VAEASLKQEMEKLATQFGAKGQDFTKFPTFEFKGNNTSPFLSFINTSQMGRSAENPNMGHI